MTKPDPDLPGTLRLSNATSTNLSIWLEPWVDELSLPPRSELALHTLVAGGEPQWPEIEISENVLTVWGVGCSTLTVEIDGVAQDTVSASQASPDFGALGARGFIETVFGDFPEARPGGHPQQQKPKPRWLWRLLGR